MALQTDKISLPKTVAAAITTKVKDSSTIAALSPQQPQIFADADNLVFDGAAEAEVVAEGAQKSSYEQTLTTVHAKRVKIQTTTRVSNELQWADEDNQLQILAQIQTDQAAALGRALDYIVYHAINPKTMAVLSGFDKLSAQAVPIAAASDILDSFDKLVSAVNESYDITGLALSKKMANQMRGHRNTLGARTWPEIPLNLQTATVDGLTAATSSTVSAPKAAVATKVLAFIGDFNLIRWGMVRDMAAEIIPYGDPDHTGVDLKANNQVAFRTEAVLGFSVIDAKGFACLKEAA